MAAAVEPPKLTELAQRYLDLIRTFITIVEQRNPYNIDHCRLVAQLCEQVAKKANLSKPSRTLLIRSAELHTLGIALSMEEKKPHFALPITKLGFSSGRELPSHQRERQILTAVLGGIPELEPCIEVICDRNEWFDGTGSLFGKSGEAISGEARLLAVVDAFIDQCTPKKHRIQVSSRQALERILECSGSQFDPRAVELLHAALAESDDGTLKEASRAGHFETSRCRHYLNLGHLYIAIHETDWALRSYLKAERVAVEIQDSGLELGAISGQVMAYSERGQLELAREALQRARARTHSEREKHGYHLMWGLIEWLSGRERNGQDILEGLIAYYRGAHNLPGLVASLTFQSYLLLTHRGLDNEDHRDTLIEFLHLVGNFDMFDVVERYRRFTLPLFLSALLKGLDEPTARANLSKMGEPCQQALLDDLRGVSPSLWMTHLQPDPVIPSVSSPLPARHQPKQVLDSASLQVNLLGCIMLKLGDKEVSEDDWPTQKALRLFAHLAVTRSALSDAIIMETLWPDAVDSKARNSLRNAIHQIRSVLKKLVEEKAPEAISRGRKSGTLALTLDVVLDTERFQSHLQNATTAIDSGDAQQAISEAKQALALYRGDFMEGFQDEWVEGLRVGFRELQQRALGTLARAYLKAEQYEEAEVAARRMLLADDLREEAHEVAIRALAGDGRSAEAIRHYEQAVNLFEQEIGVLPTHLTAVLQEVGLLL